MIARLLALVLLAGVAQPALAADWRMDAGASTLGFIATQGSTRVEGGFRQFTATIHFDPAALDRTRIDVVIPIASVFAGARDRDQALPTPDWFNAARFPTARFQAKRLEAIEGERYQLTADLTIRDVVSEVTLPVTIRVTGERAVASGELVIDRTRFGVGQGSFATGSLVGTAVTIHFSLTATR
jgi:polyisoprenoid-binding protein YceI